jgi:hypothetical protein
MAHVDYEDAKFVVDSSAGDFAEALLGAIDATGTVPSPLSIS